LNYPIKTSRLFNLAIDKNVSVKDMVSTSGVDGVGWSWRSEIRAKRNIHFHHKPDNIFYFTECSQLENFDTKKLTKNGKLTPQTSIVEQNK